MKLPNFTALIGEAPNQRRIEPTEARVRQALTALAAAGHHGITSLEVSSWALRLGHYIWLLRTKYGVTIETVHEPHDIGGVQGSHARYRALDRIEILNGSEPAARAA